MNGLGERGSCSGSSLGCYGISNNRRKRARKASNSSAGRSSIDRTINPFCDAMGGACQAIGAEVSGAVSCTRTALQPLA